MAINTSRILVLETQMAAVKQQMDSRHRDLKAAIAALAASTKADIDALTASLEGRRDNSPFCSPWHTTCTRFVDPQQFSPPPRRSLILDHHEQVPSSTFSGQSDSTTLTASLTRTQATSPIHPPPRNNYDHRPDHHHFRHQLRRSSIVDPYHRLELPYFSGSDPHGWVSKCNELFLLYSIPEDQKVDLISSYLEGRAHIWFEGWSFHRFPLIWGNFVGGLLRRFGSQEQMNVVVACNQLQQPLYLPSLLSEQTGFVGDSQPLRGVPEQLDSKLDINGQSHGISTSTLSLEFPSVDGETPKEWIRECELLFDELGIQDQRRAELETAEFHRRPAVWFWNWGFNRLRLLESVEEYYQQFEVLKVALLRLDPTLPEAYFIEGFLCGLPGDIQASVRKSQPQTLIQAYHTAHLGEDAIVACKVQKKSQFSDYLSDGDTVVVTVESLLPPSLVGGNGTLLVEKKHIPLATTAPTEHKPVLLMQRPQTMTIPNQVPIAGKVLSAETTGFFQQPQDMVVDKGGSFYSEFHGAGTEISTTVGYMYEGGRSNSFFVLVESQGRGTGFDFKEPYKELGWTVVLSYGRGKCPELPYKDDLL